MQLRMNSPSSAGVLLEHAHKVLRDVVGPDDSPATVTIHAYRNGSFGVEVQTDSDAHMTIGPCSEAD